MEENVNFESIPEMDVQTTLDNYLSAKADLMANKDAMISVLLEEQQANVAQFAETSDRIKSALKELGYKRPKAPAGAGKKRGRPAKEKTEKK